MVESERGGMGSWPSKKWNVMGTDIMDRRVKGLDVV